MTIALLIAVVLLSVEAVRNLVSQFNVQRRLWVLESLMTQIIKPKQAEPKSHRTMFSPKPEDV